MVKKNDSEDFTSTTGERPANLFHRRLRDSPMATEQKKAEKIS